MKIKVEGVDRLTAKLEERAYIVPRSGKVDVIVGFTAAYAVYVHEDMTAYHRVGQAKYLEQPARMIRSQLTRIIAENVRKGMRFAQALLVAGLRLQREAQQLVPIDTGLLKNSAFTRFDGSTT